MDEQKVKFFKDAVEESDIAIAVVREFGDGVIDRETRLLIHAAALVMTALMAHDAGRDLMEGFEFIEMISTSAAEALLGRTYEG